MCLSMECTVVDTAAKNILIVEDDFSIRENLIALLEEEGFKVTPAEDGLAGINKACETFPDLIICDILMPRLSGYSLLAALRLNHITASIPIIFLTALQNKFDMGYGMLLGAVDYITKPYSSSDLLKSINYYLDNPESRPFQLDDANLFSQKPVNFTDKPKANRKRASFPEKIERAIRASSPNSVEKMVFYNQPVLPVEIKQRIKVLWQKYDENPNGMEGLIAVWLESKLH